MDHGIEQGPGVAGVAAGSIIRHLGAGEREHDLDGVDAERVGVEDARTGAVADGVARRRTLLAGSEAQVRAPLVAGGGMLSLFPRDTDASVTGVHVLCVRFANVHGRAGPGIAARC